MTAPTPDALRTALDAIAELSFELSGHPDATTNVGAPKHWAKVINHYANVALDALASPPVAGEMPLCCGECGAIMEGNVCPHTIHDNGELEELRARLRKIAETPQASDHRLDAAGTTAYRLDGVRGLPSGDEPGRMPETPAAQLDALLKDAGLVVKFGLRQQGHYDTVTKMRADGASWHDIGAAINWSPDAVEKYYRLEAPAFVDHAALVARLREVGRIYSDRNEFLPDACPVGAVPERTTAKSASHLTVGDCHAAADALSGAPSPDSQLVADLLAEYADDNTKEACDACEQCSEIVMCSFHSLLSALARRTWTTGAIERDAARRRAGAPSTGTRKGDD